MYSAVSTATNQFRSKYLYKITHPACKFGWVIVLFPTIFGVAKSEHMCYNIIVDNFITRKVFL